MIDTMPAKLSRAIRAPGRIGADLDEMKNLLAAQPDLVNEIDPWDNYPLTLAADVGNVEAVKLLLAAGAKVNAEGEWEKTALHVIAGRHTLGPRPSGLGKPVEVVKLLLAAGADIHARDYRSCTPLQLAATSRTKVELEIVEALIAAGSDVNTVDNVGRSVLMTASDEASPAILRALIAAGANVNAVSSRGTPLSFAAENNRADNAAVLLESGADSGFRFAADLENPDLAGKTALDVARAKKAKKVITLLQEAPRMPARTQAAAPSVAQSWKRIEAWLDAHNPKLRAGLHPPASDADLSSLESIIGRKLPQDFKEAWRMHNGNADMATSLLPPLDEPGDIYGNSESPGGYYLLPVEEMIQQWQGWKELTNGGEFAGQSSGPDKGIQDAWWHPGWISFASNGGGDSFCLDLAPTADGTAGQIITMNHETPERELLAPSFAQWLASLAELMGQERSE